MREGWRECRRRVGLSRALVGAAVPQSVLCGCSRAVQKLTALGPQKAFDFTHPGSAVGRIFAVPASTTFAPHSPLRRDALINSCKEADIRQITPNTKLSMKPLDLLSLPFYGLITTC